MGLAVAKFLKSENRSGGKWRMIAEKPFSGSVQ